MFDVLLQSSRAEMSRWMREINAQFVSQVGFTTDRLNPTAGPQSSECIEKTRSEAGNQIQDIIREVIADIDLYQRDYVYLLLDVTDQYVSFSQKWTQIAWFGTNMVTDFNTVLFTTEFYAESYQQMFEISVEEILIEMGHFSRLVDATRRRAFTALNNIEEQSQRNFVSCSKTMTQ